MKDVWADITNPSNSSVLSLSLNFDLPVEVGRRWEDLQIKKTSHYYHVNICVCVDFHLIHSLLQQRAASYLHPHTHKTHNQPRAVCVRAWMCFCVWTNNTLQNHLGTCWAPVGATSDPVCEATANLTCDKLPRERQDMSTPANVRG